MNWTWLDKRPIIIAIAGSNGAGKTTFFNAHLALAGLRFVNADEIAKTVGLDAYSAAKAADSIRREFVRSKESFVFETVFSDPIGEKIHFLSESAQSGYTVVLCFIGINDPLVSEERVAMRVSQGGHDVPSTKLKERFPRTLANLRQAISVLPLVLMFDNSHLDNPFQLTAIAKDGIVRKISKQSPEWLTTVLS